MVGRSSIVSPGPANLVATTSARSGYKQPGWSPGQRILNDIGAREPEHTFHQPVPIVARIVWADDGEEQVETVALGWSGRGVYVRMTDTRYRLRAVWLDAADVIRR
jgi:hypothetical protein